MGVRVAVIPDPVKYARNLYLHFLYSGIDANITGPSSVLSPNKPHILHVHFPDHVLSVPISARMVGRAATLFAILALARLRRIRVVWTVHNIQSHHAQPTRLNDFFYRSFSSFADGLIFHSNAMRLECLHCYPWLSNRISAVVRHPIYPMFALSPDEKSPIQRLGIKDTEFLVCIVGFIRGNKNLIRVVRDFVHLKSNWTLVIAGEVLDFSVDAAINEITAGRKNIHYLPGFLSEGGFDAIIMASDVVAIPYGALHTSGVAVRTLSRRRKVLCLSSPEMHEIKLTVPSMVRIVDSIGLFWSALPESREAAWDGSERVGLPEEFSPPRCQDKLARFYRSLVLRDRMIR